MLCEKILGVLSEEKYAGKSVDYVDIEWYEAFTKLHRKTSAGGEDVGIRLDQEAQKKGLNQDDVLYADEQKVIAVNIPECEVMEVTVDKTHPGQIARVCYEIGNTHSSLFWGKDEYTFLAPYNEPLLEKLSRLHGVSARKIIAKFNFDDAISSTISQHHH